MQRCNRSCLDRKPSGKPTGTRCFPLARLCCAVELYRRTPEWGREALLAVVTVQVGRAQAEAIREAVR